MHFDFGRHATAKPLHECWGVLARWGAHSRWVGAGTGKALQVECLPMRTTTVTRPAAGS